MSDYLSARQAADVIGTTEKTVRKWISDGKLNAERTDRSFRIRRVDAEAMRTQREPEYVQDWQPSTNGHPTLPMLPQEQGPSMYVSAGELVGLVRQIAELMRPTNGHAHMRSLPEGESEPMRPEDEADPWLRQTYALLNEATATAVDAAESARAARRAQHAAEQRVSALRLSIEQYRAAHPSHEEVMSSENVVEGQRRQHHNRRAGGERDDDAGDGVEPANLLAGSGVPGQLLHERPAVQRFPE